MKHLHKGALISVLAVLFGIAVLGAVTYAWFTSNQTVSTSRVEAHTGSSDIRLLVSTQGGAAFAGAEEAAIVQVNTTNAEKLMPVSTADLETFVQSTVTKDDYASAFAAVTNENLYYHGRLFIKAEAAGQRSDAHLSLYLDESMTAGGKLVQADDNSLLLNAARLGLRISEQPSPFIFYLSEEDNPAGARKNNTNLGGTVLEDDQVLTVSRGSITAVSDPAVPLGTYAVSSDAAGGVVVPDTPLLKMEINKIYQIDVYFYLEGCDPDCTESISYDGGDLHLAFFGVAD